MPKVALTVEASPTFERESALYSSPDERAS